MLSIHHEARDGLKVYHLPFSPFTRLVSFQRYLSVVSDGQEQDSWSIRSSSYTNVVIWFFNFNVRVHRYSTSSYERHCSKKASPERKETGIYTYLYSILHTRAPVILGQVRNRSKHNSPIKKRREKRICTPTQFSQRRSRFPTMIDAAYDSRKAVYYFLFQEPDP